MSNRNNLRNKRTQKKKSTFDTKRIALYVIALIFVFVIIRVVPNITQVFLRVENGEESAERIIRTLEFRKDGELDFIDVDGTVIVTIDIEIAEDDGARMQGLMNRETLGQREGMLFKFYPTGTPNVVSMWMRNTILPLDMIFIRQNKVISQVVEDTVPFDETNIVSNEPVGYVLEVNAGFAERYGIKPGLRTVWRR